MRDGAAARGQEAEAASGAERRDWGYAGSAGGARTERRRPVFREAPFQAPCRFVGRKDSQYSKDRPD